MATSFEFKKVGHAVVLLTPDTWIHKNDIDGSEYLSSIHGLTVGDAPHFDLQEEVSVQRACLEMIRERLIASAHDVSDGGLAVCLAESVLASDGLGAQIEIRSEPELRRDALLFGEAQSRIVVSLAPEQLQRVTEIGKECGVSVTVLGSVTDGPLEIAINGENGVRVSGAALRDVYEGAIPAYMS
jgi:phosphoribosylformylglycinamidine synthase